MADVPAVLFVCTHNAGRSQMAAALLAQQASGRVRVTSAGSAPASELNTAVVQAMAEIGLDISAEFPKPLTAGKVQAADIVIVRANLPDALFAGAHKLKAAISHGAGLDMIPVEAATAAGVLVANVPGVNARSVVEYVIFAALALARRFRAIDTDLRQKGWLAGRAHSLSGVWPLLLPLAPYAEALEARAGC